MANALPPVPHIAPIVDDASVATPVWADFFTQLLARAGGSLGKTGDFQSSHGAIGYQRFPGGLVIQWGSTGSVNSGATSAVDFPIEFETFCAQVFSCIKDNSAIATTQTGHWGTGNYSNASFDLYNRTSIALAFNWLAVGY